MGLILRICRDVGELDDRKFWDLPVEVQNRWIAFYTAEFEGDFLSPEQRRARQG